MIEQYPATSSGTSIFNVPLRVRSASNPGGRGHLWVRDRFVNPKTKVEGALFVPATLRDNPSLDRESYERNLEHLSAVDRERLKRGDWEVHDIGEMFDRVWFKSVPSTEGITGNRVRFWDRAATDGGGDWTVGTLMCLSEDGRWYVEDVVRGQWSSHKCEQVIRNTAMRDGQNVRIRMEQEPGSSGVDVISHYRRHVLVGYNFSGVRSTGSKTERAVGLESAAEAGNVHIVEARWNTAWLDEFELFPIGSNDDQVDSTAGAFNELALARRSRLIV